MNKPSSKQMNPPDIAHAACLTPPAAGGVAMIQVVGCDAARIVSRFLKGRHFIDLEQLPSGRLQLCRFVSDNETIDDAIVASRRHTSGEFVVDISVHGGQRIVQRILLALRDAGVQITDARDISGVCRQAANAIESEALTALMTAKTRRVSQWLMHMPESLSESIAQMVEHIQTGAVAEAANMLRRGIQSARRGKHLLDGVRVLIVGEPNVGKSTLANALAQREHAVVSELPGTTRDWVEHPGAVQGVPFTFVDTAGIRQTDDSIEREAIQRSVQQIASADVVLHVFDASHPPTAIEEQVASESPDNSHRLLAWNKSDLGMHEAQRQLCSQAAGIGIGVSGLTGEGLTALRRMLCQAVGLADWDVREPIFFTSRQVSGLQATLSALQADTPKPKTAVDRLTSLIKPETLPDDS